MIVAVGLKPSLPMDHPFSRHSNSAGAPLPRIPKRTPSASRSIQTVSSIDSLLSEEHRDPSTPIKPPSPPAALVIEPPTPPPMSPVSKPRRDMHSQPSASGSSSSHDDSPIQFTVTRQRRTRSVNVSAQSMRPPEESTPTPSLFRAKSSAGRVAFPSRPFPVDTATCEDTPRPSMFRGSTLRPTTTVSVPEPSTAVRPEPVVRSVSVSIPSEVSSQLIRKKSGEPLKSSLKSRRRVARGDLSVVTASVVASKSEPNTPTQCKSVHFDAQLEHVKLFIAEQKPLAVSRDGSPTTDTSGTDSDFPSFIYGPDDRSTKTLVMEVVNMPATINKDADVAMEELVLSTDRTSANGRVRVRNIAFEKWIAVRFTFDWWQTTSEVTAKYMQTVEEGKFDVFVFTIRLNDMLSRIEEKTLFMAIRYTVTGQEIWDNNLGENYQIKFSRTKAELKKADEVDPAIAGLKSKLEKVAIGRETVGGYLAHQSRKSPSPRGDQFDLRSDTPLSSRYDFSASLKRPWKGGSPVSPTSHSRNSTYPDNLPHSPQRTFNSVPLQRKMLVDPTRMTRGSPRILDPDDEVTSPGSFYAGSDSEDTPSSTRVVFSRSGGRHHQRGYFDLGLPAVGTPRKTLPAAFRDDAIPRYGNADTPRGPSSTKLSLMTGPTYGPWPIERGGSDESTPSITSTSESSRSSSPSSSPLDDGVIFNFLDAHAERVSDPVNDNLNMFLNKFCFYTGSDSLLDVQPDVIQRSHSASSVEEFLFSPKPSYHLSPAQTPTRSPSFDDVTSMSGASTPIARSMMTSGTATPVLPLAY